MCDHSMHTGSEGPLRTVLAGSDLAYEPMRLIEKIRDSILTQVVWPNVTQLCRQQTLVVARSECVRWVSMGPVAPIAGLGLCVASESWN